MENSPQYRIGEICAIVKGSYPTLSTEPGEYPLVVTAPFRRSASTYQLEGPAVCVPLISSTGHGDAAMHRVHYQEGKFALANLLVALLPKNPDQCDVKYLYHLLMAKKDDYFVPLMTGTANVSLKEKDIANVLIPLPPLAEQRRIVARIEELAARIEEARGLRRAAMEEGERIVTTQAGRLVGDPYNNIQGELLFSQFAKIEEVALDVADGPHATPQYTSQGIPFITVLNIASGRLNFSGAKFISPDDHAFYQKRAKAEKGDVLISKDGSIGIPCFIDTDREFSFFVSVALIKPKHHLLDGRFLTWMLQTPYLQERMRSRSRGDMIRHLVLREIRDLLIPLPPLEEQRRIVAYLDELQAKADELKRVQAESAAELEALLPAVLEEAFAGRL